MEKAAFDISEGKVPIATDPSDAVNLDKLFQAIQEKQGELDVVFVNAGVTNMVPLGTVPEDSMDALYSINVTGVVAHIENY